MDELERQTAHGTATKQQLIISSILWKKQNLFLPLFLNLFSVFTM